MRYIIIMGDSWGEPNWRRPQPGFTPQGHTANLLAQRGYTVFNYSESGRGNMTSWLKLQKNPPPRADHIIWFHTEIVRDMSNDYTGLLNEQLDLGAEQIYRRIQGIQQQYVEAADLIVIEGQSQVHQPHFDRYFPQRRLIADWRAELLAQDSLPYTPLLAQICGEGDAFARWTDSSEVKQQMLTDTERVLDLMRDSELFPDNAHPGDLAHEQLTNRLIELIAAKR
jgi:hypothetical protein